nr:hypothetical protein Itr_chr03CG09740 [Ipomoea trifida]
MGGSLNIATAENDGGEEAFWSAGIHLLRVAICSAVSHSTLWTEAAEDGRSSMADRGDSRRRLERSGPYSGMARRELAIVSLDQRHRWRRFSSSTREGWAVFWDGETR